GAVAIATLVAGSWAWNGPKVSRSPESYVGVPSGAEKTESLLVTSAYWNDRLTYPTGVFKPAWVRAAARDDARISSGVPAGQNGPHGSDWTSLGPRPGALPGRTGRYDYGFTEGRINWIAVDPTTTTNGSIVAYAASVGGGVWKTTNCCAQATTTWNVVSDAPLISAISIDTLAIDPNDHNTIYAGTGDLNFGSFSMGSQGILKSVDA